MTAKSGRVSLRKLVKKKGWRKKYDSEQRLKKCATEGDNSRGACGNEFGSGVSNLDNEFNSEVPKLNNSQDGSAADKEFDDNSLFKENNSQFGSVKDVNSPHAAQSYLNTLRVTSLIEKLKKHIKDSRNKPLGKFSYSIIKNPPPVQAQRSRVVTVQKKCCTVPVPPRA